MRGLRVLVVLLNTRPAPDAKEEQFMYRRWTMLAITSLSGLILLLLGSMLLAEDNSTAKEPILSSDTKMRVVVVDKFWQTNCYILYGKNNQAILIDPGDQLVLTDKKLLADPDTGKATPATAEELLKATPEGTVEDPVTGKQRRVYWEYRATGEDVQKIYDVLKQNKLTLKYMVITHGHIDHIAGARFLKEKTGAKILMNREDTRGKNGEKLPPPTADEKIDAYPKDAYTIEGGLPKVDQFVKEGDIISLDGMSFQVMQTPGHSPGSISLRTKMKDTVIIFDGDTLIYHTIGRTNFRDGTGDNTLLLRSIREKLLCYPDNTVLFPGHYQATTVGEEKANNLYIK